MTNDQKNAIRDAVKNVFDTNYTCTHDNIETIVATIEKYDELANKEFNSFVKNFIHLFDPSKENKPPESKPESENVIFFKSNDSNDIRVFNSLTELINKLSDEYHCFVAIHDDSTSAKYDINWPNPHFLVKLSIDNNGIIHIGEYIGICDYLSLKKG